MTLSEVEIDLNRSADIAEAMINSFPYDNPNIIDFTSSIALIIGTMSSNFGIDSMIIIQDIENIVNKFESVME